MLFRSANPAALYIVGDSGLVCDSSAVTTDSSSDSAWYYSPMTYNSTNGTYTYTVDSVVAGKYSYNICAYANGGSYGDWNAGYSSNQSVTIENSDKVLDYTSNNRPTWDKEPGYTSSSTKKVTITYTEQSSNNYWPDEGNSRAVCLSSSVTLTNAVWNGNLVWSSGNTYTYSFDTEENTVYVGIQVYMESSNRLIGSTTSNAFTVTFNDDVATASFTITAPTFSALSSAYAGTASNAVNCTVS